PDADPRAALEAEREKSGGERVDPLGQFRPRPANAMARRNQRLALPPAPHCLVEDVPDGLAQQRRIGDAANIAVRNFCQVRLSKRQARVLRDRDTMSATSLRGAQ